MNETGVGRQLKTGHALQEKPLVLFICTHNAARSRIAEGYLRKKYGDHVRTASAGTDIREVHPLATAVMAEIGIDISSQRSRHVSEFFRNGADIVVTVCDSAQETCPVFPGARIHLHAGFPDPSAFSGTPHESEIRFREIRDAIISWIDQVLIPRLMVTTPVCDDYPVINGYESVRACDLERFCDK